MSIRQSLTMASLAATLCACGGGGGGTFDGRSAFGLPTLPFEIDAIETALDVDDPQVVLVAALTVAASADALRMQDVVDIDAGHAAPGNGVQRCSTGSIDETVSESALGGERVVTLDADQCFDALSDSVQNGRLSLRWIPLDEERIEGNLTYGSDEGAIFALAQPVDGTVHRFRQARGTIALLGEANGESGSATLDGLSLILGSGPRPPDSTPFGLTRRMEVRAGAPGLELVIQSSRIGNLDAVGTSGRFVIQGGGLEQETACVLSAGFDAHTTSALQFGAADGIPRGGAMMLGTATGNAAATFNVNGDVEVTTDNGDVQRYGLATIRGLCGL